MRTMNKRLETMADESQQLRPAAIWLMGMLVTAWMVFGPSSLSLAQPPGSCSPWPECKNDSGGDSGTIEVVATFRDLGDQIGSDDLGPYAGEIDKARFNIPLGGLGRNLSLDFSSCVSSDPSDCRPPFSADYTEAAITWLAVRGSKDEDLLNDPALNDIELRIRFEEQGTLWFLDFNPNISTCEGGAGYASMDRLDSNTWSFSSTAGIACLQEQVRVGRGNKTENQFRGLYQMSFAVDVVRQP